MELKAIKKITKWILEEINGDEKKLIYHKYNTFLDWFGMVNKNKKILKKVDYQLKKNNIALKCNNEQRLSISDFRRGEIATFYINAETRNENDFADTGNEKIENNNAGTISVNPENSGIKLYNHQQAAIQKLSDEIIKSGKYPFAGLLVLPTGGGKTLTAAYWLSKNILDKKKKILWIAHRHELLNQAKSTFERLAFKDIFPTKESFNYRLISGIHDKPVHIKATDDIIISSKDSLNSNDGFKYLYDKWLKGNTDEIFLVIDEAHHATAKTYRNLISNLQTKVAKFRMLGLTATPFRTAEAEKGLLAKVFPDNIIDNVNLKTLINQEILSKPVFEEVQTNIDWKLTDEQIKQLSFSGIDSLGEVVTKTITENNDRNGCIVNRYIKNKDKYKKTIVFALNQTNAIALNALFKKAGIKSDFVISGTMDAATRVSTSREDNAVIIDRFRQENGGLDVLINVNILTEGTDLPRVQSIFLARPTISPILMTQMIGRGLRGEKAGGTKEAYIVSFIDDWQNKIAWVNPEKLLTEENLDFTDKTAERKEQILQLISISKIEEFALLINENADNHIIESLQFLERIPLGIYHFTLSAYEDEIGKEFAEKNCDVLVYNNLQDSFKDFIKALPLIFKEYKLTERDYLTEDELQVLSDRINETYFLGSDKNLGYNLQDIKDILQYYAQFDVEPKFIQFKDREKYNVDVIAAEIIQEDLGEKAKTKLINELWDNSESEWKVFFGFNNKKYFINEITFALNRLSHPEDYQPSKNIPTDAKELRELKRSRLEDIKNHNPEYWKWLSDQVFNNSKDKDGNYECAETGYKSKYKFMFQIDHKEAYSKNGLTELSNLQLLKSSVNKEKGAKIF